MRRLLAFALTGILFIGIAGSLVGAPPAEAAPSSSVHSLPGAGVSGVTRLCGPRADYSCTTGGYAGVSESWWGAKYGAGWASVNTYGYHNCTLYAAYRVAKNGAGDPGWSGHASAWDDKANRNIVDQTSAVGAVAQWNAGPYGHVAYVEVATGDYIEVTDDNFGYNNTNRWRITRSSPAWPDNFIHFKDVSRSSSDLYFIKTRSTGSKRIEVHTASAASGYAKAVAGGRASRFTLANAKNGTFQIAGPNNDLYFIKTRSTGSKRIEVHTASAASGYTKAVAGGKASRFTLANAKNGTFQIAGPNNDLYYIKTKSTGSKRIEVHTASAASGYAKAVAGGRASRFAVAAAKNGTFQIAGPNNDLYFIKTRNTGSKRIEVHTASAASGYAKAVAGGRASRFAVAAAKNGTFQIAGPNNDLYFIKTRSTGSKRIEVHTASSASGYAKAVAGGKASRFALAAAKNGTFHIR